MINSRLVKIILRIETETVWDDTPMTKFGFVVALIGISVVVAGCSCQGEGCNELANKPIYADLQGIEFEHRSAKLNGPVILKGAVDVGKYDALGIPADAGAYPSVHTVPNVWIVLNTDNGNGGVAFGSI